ncbi:MAG: aromatic amino acid transport family protein [archaeon]
MFREFDKKFWAATFTLAGTIIGAGILGLPYVFAKSGFLIGLFWLLILGVIMIYCVLCLGEVSLRTKKNHQLPGYAKKYLGKWGEGLMLFAVVFGVYSALLAYLIGESQSFSLIFTGGLDYAIYFAIGFWLIMTLLLKEGLKGLKKIESWGVLIILGIVLIIVAYYFPKVNFGNLDYTDFSYLFLPFGVVLFALMGFTSIPELRMEIRGNEKKLKKAIIVGILIPIIVYAVFSLVFVGVLGKNVPEVATLSFGKLVILLGIFTMLTSYFVLSFCLKDVFKFDLKYSKKWSFILVSLIPLFVYFILYFFNWLSFVNVLGIGGVVSGGLTGILILLINIKAKKLGNRKPEFSVPINWFVIGLISLIYIGGIVVELVF